MNAFTPPVPPIPIEHRNPVSSLQSDSTLCDGFRPVDPRKPLPPIFQSPSTMRDSEDVDEKSIVFVDKAMPPLPPATPVRSTTAPTITNKRRSMSVSDVDPIVPPTPIVVSPPTIKGSNSRRGQLGDSSIPGLLDLFNGELSTFEPFSGPSLDLRDLSTPPRPSNLNSKPDIPALGSHETTYKRVSKSILSDPFDGMQNTADGASAAGVFPPRSSSLKLSVSSTQQSTTLRQATPSRSRTTPSTSTQTLTPRSANGMRHYSNASISEPSLVPSLGDGHARESL